MTAELVGEAFWARVGEGLPPFPGKSPAILAAAKRIVARGSDALERL